MLTSSFVFVATVEHGVPLMWSKWVHRTWAHQGGTQGQGTRLADGPPICPTASRRAASRTKARDSGTLWGPLDPEAGMEVPGTPTPGRRPSSSPGANLHTRAKRISLPAQAGSSQKTWAPRRWRRRGGQGWKTCQSLSALPGKGGRPHLTPSEEYLDEKKPRRPLRRTRRGFPAKTPPAPRVHLWYPFSL